MSSITTRAMIAEKYGLRLSVEQLADVIGLKPQTVRNMLSTGELPIATYREGTRRWASYEAVADYLDRMSEAAREEFQKQKAQV